MAPSPPRALPSPPAAQEPRQGHGDASGLSGATGVVVGLALSVALWLGVLACWLLSVAT